MNELTSLALELQSFCEQRNWRFCLIGGLAVQHWGEPRFTKHVDMTLLTGFGNEEPFIAEWLACYEWRGGGGGGDGMERVTVRAGHPLGAPQAPARCFLRIAVEPQP